MKIHEVFYLLIMKARFYYLQVTLQAQHANSIRVLISNSNKACGHSCVIQNECQV